jgi:hypothetical protein
MTEGTPVERLMLLSTDYILARCLHVVAELGVADALDDTPQATAALAAATGTHPGALGRVLRLLAAPSATHLLPPSIHPRWKAHSSCLCPQLSPAVWPRS